MLEIKEFSNVITGAADIVILWLKIEDAFWNVRALSGEVYFSLILLT